jgi:hypothetical protein
MLQRLYPVNHRKTQQESRNRNRAQSNQSHIDSPMQPLARKAMRTFNQVLLVISAHFRSNP